MTMRKKAGNLAEEYKKCEFLFGIYCSFLLIRAVSFAAVKPIRGLPCA